MRCFRRSPSPTQNIWSGSTPDTRYSSTSVTSSGIVDGEDSRALSRFERAELGVESQRPRSLQRRTFEEPRRRHAWRQCPHRRQFGEHVQVRRARKAVGADRDADPGGIEVADGRRAGAGVPVASRTGDERAAARGQSLADRPASSARRARRAHRDRESPRHPETAPACTPGGVHDGSHDPTDFRETRATVRLRSG